MFEAYTENHAMNLLQYLSKFVFYFSSVSGFPPWYINNLTGIYVIYQNLLVHWSHPHSKFKNNISNKRRNIINP